MFPIRWTWYFARVVLHDLFRFLRLIGRTSSRVIVLLGILTLAVVNWYEMQVAAYDLLMAWNPTYMPEDFVLQVGAVILTILACLAWLIASAIVKLVVIPFRVGMRPLPPMRKLKATEAKITSAVVRIVVPRLSRR